jgi:5-methylcytosine-specific restriction endonuclease McrA
MEKKCNVCGEVKPLRDFYERKASKDGHAHHCKKCNAARVLKTFRKNKLKAIEYKGGKCAACGGVFHPAVFDFHHINPEEKEIKPSDMRGWKWEKQKAELDKCVLLCSNCHRLEHAKDHD